ncbi:MAG TPA: type II toxin-antitoxin system VapB family antitoxin [Kiritimatiellia bacterium]|nr:type II toxin-antitoxin system VapB family antitoxin [Kiritimatiellia bacterium]HMP33083.1 type II toxin-antitoxin system VapB family antitoxin [Kiritimatiellia bacterium]
MKTTVELDEKKLLRVMSLGGFATRKEAIDYALTEAEKKTRLKALEEKPFYVSNGPVIAPGYDVIRLRRQEVKSRARRH